MGPDVAYQEQKQEAGEQASNFCPLIRQEIQNSHKNKNKYHQHDQTGFHGSSSRIIVRGSVHQAVKDTPTPPRDQYPIRQGYYFHNSHFAFN
jgi:hypothetical protein